MNTRTFVSFIALAVLATQAATAGLYKCEGADGTVGYQDQPCAADEKEEVRQQSATLIPSGEEGMSLKRVAIPDVGEALVPVFDSMTARTRNHSGAATTVVLKSRSGQEPMELYITLFANNRETPFNIISAREHLRSLDANLARHPYNYGERWNFEMAYTSARFMSVIQEGPLQPGQQAPKFTTTSVGYAEHPRVIAWILILNNGGTSESLKQALKVVNALQILDHLNGEVL